MLAFCTTDVLCPCRTLDDSLAGFGVLLFHVTARISETDMEDDSLGLAAFLACRIAELVVEGAVDVVGCFGYLALCRLQHTLLEVVDVLVLVGHILASLLVLGGEQYLAQLLVLDGPGAGKLVGIDEQVDAPGIARREAEHGVLQILLVTGEREEILGGALGHVQLDVGAALLLGLVRYVDDGEHDDAAHIAVLLFLIEECALHGSGCLADVAVVGRIDTQFGVLDRKGEVIARHTF